MSWKPLNEVLASLKLHPNIKNKLKTQALKKFFKTKFNFEDISFRKGRLEIKVNSPALLQELSFKKEEIKREINDFLKEEIIKEIIVKRS